jgi:lysozyme family protein
MSDMVNAIFQKAFKIILGHEGSYSNHPNDAGGETMYGIIISVARKHGYTGAMKDMPLSIAEKIYYSDYWQPNKLDEVAAWYEAAAIEMFDIGVNMGIGTASRFLQRAINILNRNQAMYENIVVDGKIGAKTLAALHKLKSDADKACLVKVLNIMQGARYIDIMERRESQEVFARGWFKRVSLA